MKFVFCCCCGDEDKPEDEISKKKKELVVEIPPRKNTPRIVIQEPSPLVERRESVVFDLQVTGNSTEPAEAEIREESVRVARVEERREESVKVARVEERENGVAESKTNDNKTKTAHDISESAKAKEKVPQIPADKKTDLSQINKEDEPPVYTPQPPTKTRKSSIPLLIQKQKLKQSPSLVDIQIDENTEVDKVVTDSVPKVDAVDGVQPPALTLSDDPEIGDSQDILLDLETSDKFDGRRASEVSEWSWPTFVKEEEQKKIIEAGKSMNLGLMVAVSPSRKFSKIAPAPKDSPLATQVTEKFSLYTHEGQ